MNRLKLLGEGNFIIRELPNKNFVEIEIDNVLSIDGDISEIENKETEVCEHCLADKKDTVHVCKSCYGELEDNYCNECRFDYIDEINNLKEKITELKKKLNK